MKESCVYDEFESLARMARLFLHSFMMYSKEFLLTYFITYEIIRQTKGVDVLFQIEGIEPFEKMKLEQEEYYKKRNKEKKDLYRISSLSFLISVILFITVIYLHIDDTIKLILAFVCILLIILSIVFVLYSEKIKIIQKDVSDIVKLKDICEMSRYHPQILLNKEGIINLYTSVYYDRYGLQFPAVAIKEFIVDENIDDETAIARPDEDGKVLLITSQKTLNSILREDINTL